MSKGSQHLRKTFYFSIDSRQEGRQQEVHIRKQRQSKERIEEFVSKLSVAKAKDLVKCQKFANQ